MAKLTQYLNQKNNSERRLANDLLFFDQLRMRSAVKQEYVELGFADTTVELLTDKYMDDPTIEAVVSVHRSGKMTHGIIESSGAIEVFSNILQVRHREFEQVLKALSLKATASLVIDHRCSLEGPKCVARIRRDYEEYIDDGYRKLLYKKRDMYKEFNPSDVEIEQMVTTPQRKPKRLSFLEIKYLEDAYNACKSEGIRGLPLFTECAERSCTLINQIIDIINASEDRGHFVSDDIEAALK
ncbi:hypothetical protein [Vibrio agarivorans]|uniref:Uncharacterized protein n=1 Tax=Vibrio agarivorans TaxID=153622 RepID=A0ABT7Y7J4_9VIBR|nr:hypothetical protein [Vibrio agarivorans]MDN2483961.1 hypothetical protein [Vibrio agarivorans]